MGAELANQDPALALAVLPTCLAHYPELLSAVQYTSAQLSLPTGGQLPNKLPPNHICTNWRANWQVFVAPIDAVFVLAWRLIRWVLPGGTAAKFELLRGEAWRGQLARGLASARAVAALPAHMREGASS